MTSLNAIKSSSDVGIINYGAGNIFSLQAALQRIGANFKMINHADEITTCSKIIIPGVGHAGSAMHKLEQSGMLPAIKALTKPTLGICVGMQLLTSHSEEGDADLTDIIPLQTKRFLDAYQLKIPHMGWNQVGITKENILFKKIENNAHFYFVHSYYIEYHKNFTIASCNYGLKFSAAIQKNNFYGVQFHPEKSGYAGEQLLNNFIKL